MKSVEYCLCLEMIGFIFFSSISLPIHVNCLMQSDICLSSSPTFRCLDCLGIPPSLTFIISARKLNVFDRLHNVQSMAFWNSVCMSVSPLNSVLNRYLPVACPPTVLKLHFLIIFHLVIVGFMHGVRLIMEIGLPFCRTIES